jgi:signal transduction histidine kinase
VSQFARLFDGKAIRSDRAYSGRDAIVLLKDKPKGHYKAVLLDIEMETETAGLDILPDIRQYDNDIPVIYLSAYAREDKAIEQIRKGAAQMLIKPVRFPTLYYCLISAVHFAKQQREARELLIENTNKRLVINKLFNHNMKNLAMAGQLFLNSNPPGVPQAVLCFKAIHDQTRRIMAMSVEPGEKDFADLKNAITTVEKELSSNPRISEDATGRVKFTPVGDMPPLHIKAETLIALLGELICNAIVHNDNYPVHVTVSAHLESDSQVHIRVKDDGKGIPADRIPTLFRVQPDHTEHGFGLPYCYEVLRIHGGYIDYKPASIGGEFIFTIPVYPPAQRRRKDG